MHNSAKLLGYLGLIPFVGIPLLISIEQLNYYQGYLYFVQYSAIILSFFGGIHWFDAIQNNRKNHQLYMAMVPSIIAWLSLVFLTAEMLLGVLSISYIGVLMYDKFVLALTKQTLLEYIKLRVILTTVVVISHLSMAMVLK